MRISFPFAAVLLAAISLALELPAAGDEKPAPVPSNPCDIYGPGFEVVAGSDVCVRIGVSVEVGVKSSTRGHSSVATSSGWISGKRAAAGN